jgi:hypothetical protein
MEHVTGVISHGGPTHMGLGPRGIVKYTGGPRSWQHVSHRSRTQKPRNPGP